MSLNTENTTLSGWSGTEILKAAKQFEELLTSSGQVADKDYSMIDLLKLAVGKVIIDSIDGITPIDYTAGLNGIAKEMKKK